MATAQPLCQKGSGEQSVLLLLKNLPELKPPILCDDSVFLEEREEMSTSEYSVLQS